MQFSKKYITYFLITLGVLLIGVFISRYFQNNQLIEKLDINIRYNSDNQYVTESDIKKMIYTSIQNDIVGLKFSELDLEKLEQDISKNPFISKVQVYKSELSTLAIDVDLKEPIFRVINKQNESFYLSKNHRKFPLSPHFSSHTILLTGEITEKLDEKSDEIKSPFFNKISSILNAIESDKFLYAQISEIYFHKSGEITLYPSVGDIKIEFGKANKVAEKFKKLNLFYRTVLPSLGWRKYTSINLSFDNQVVATKRVL